MNFKKITFSIISLAIIILLGYLVIVRLAFGDWTDGTINENAEVKEGNKGDKLVFEYITKNFPDLFTSITISDYQNKDQIIYFVVDGELYELELKLLIDVPDIRCYEVYTVLLFRGNGSDFKGIRIGRIDMLNPQEYPLLVQVAKVLVAKKEWKWIKNCARFLQNAGDQEITKLLERYASGHFSEQELKVNKNSKFTKDEMQNYAIQILGK